MFSPRTTINIPSQVRSSFALRNSWASFWYASFVFYLKNNKNTLILKIYILALTILALFPGSTPKLSPTCEKKLGSFLYYGSYILDHATVVTMATQGLKLPIQFYSVGGYRWV